MPSNLRDRIFRQFVSISITSALAIFVAGSSKGQAQSVPVPFAATFAGGGTVCTTSLSVFAVTGTGAKYGDGCAATQATLNTPVAVATDTFGNVFIADQTNMLVRVVYNGGAALAAALAASNVQNPGLVPVKGNIYTIAGGVNSTPTETTHYCNQAGSGTVGTDTALDGCPASESEQGPRGLAVDADGNIFISSVSPVSQIRVIYVAGSAVKKLITLANPTITSPQPGYVYNIVGGNASSYTGDGALASKATLNTPRGLLIDSTESIYFTDELNNVVRRVDGSSGIITTVAGHCVASGTNCTVTATSGDGSAATSTNVNIYYPYAVAEDQNGNLFIAEGGSASSGGRIRVVYVAGTLPGIASPVVGDIYTYAGGASGTTPAQLTAFQYVYGVSVDPEGYIYATDYRSGSTGSNKIWRIDPTNGNIAAIAGNGASALTSGAHCNGGLVGPTATDTRGDGCPATQAYLNTPQETLAFDARGDFYVADRSNNVVRSFAYNNLFASTAVGSSVTQPLAFLYPAGSTPETETFALQGTGNSDYSDAGGDTCALNTKLTSATTCVDTLKFAPTAGGQRPGSFSVTGGGSTIATQRLSGIGNAAVLTIDPGTEVQLGSAIEPISVSTDLVGNVDISDGNSKQVLRTTLASGATTPYIAGLGMPRQTTTDSSGNLYVADSVNNKIVEVTPVGVVSSLGSGLSGPQGVAADVFGNLYVADTGNNRLVYLSPVTGNQITIPLSGFTLSAPTYLALDASGDLYIIDTNKTRVLKIPFAATPQQINLPNSAQPAAIAFDSAGDTFLADTVSGSILFVAAGSATSTPLVTQIGTPAGVAVGPSGNLFVADASASSVTGYNRDVNITAFASTNVQLTSLPSTLSLGNAGNVTATLSTPPYIETGTTTAFPSTGTPSCTPGFTLTSGSFCTQAFAFAPNLPGSEAANVLFSTTAGQSATANLSGTATNLILTSLALTLNNTGNVDYGQLATYTATLNPASMGSAAPTGTIQFLVDGSVVTTDPVSTNPYTFGVSLAVGTHSVATIYGGDSIYAGSNASTSITIGKSVTTVKDSYSQTASGTLLSAVVTPASTGAVPFTGNVIFYVDGSVVATVPVGTGTVSTTVLIADGTHTYYVSYAGDANYAASSSTPQPLTVARGATSTALTITPTSSNGVAVLLLSAKVVGTGTPTGTVTFSNATTMLGVVNLSTAVNGTVTFTTASTSFMTYSFIASYSGDGLFDPSTVTVNEGPDFAVISPTTPLVVPQGAQAIQAISIVPINGYTGTLTATCSNLPANAICRFLPTPVTITSSATSTLSVQVYAGINTSVARLESPGHRLSSGDSQQRAMLALFLLTPLGFFLRKRRRLAPLGLLAVISLAVGLLGLSGCGLKTPAAVQGSYSTPIGSTAVTVTVTDANNLSRSAVFTVQVNSM